MGLSVGIVGLPNVGKSTLFNALLKKRVALSANYPFATIEPNTGVVAVPDERLEKLAFLVAKEEGMISKDKDIDSLASLQNDKSKLPPLVPAVVEFVDIAGLVKGASTGAGLGNQFLSHIREVDAIIHVLRDFKDPSAGSGQVPIIREGSTDPKSDREIVETELAFADLQVIEKLIENAKKEAGNYPNFRYSKNLVEVLEEIKSNLEQGKILGKYHFEDEHLQRWFNSLPILTIKPVLYVFNVGEGEYSKRLKDVTLEGAERPIGSGSNKDSIGPISSNLQNDSIVICAKVEEELVDITDEEKKEYLKEMGIEETGLERLIKKAYQLLGLASFLTAGPKEVRAWTIKKGTKAPQAAGVIHTDFEKKFIRAQVIEYEKLLEAGSYALAKQKGWIRTEGKDYEVKDGDVVEFLIS